MSYDKKKKFYAVGEKVYVKPLKEFGVIESLDIQPKTEDGKGIYEANVKVGEDVGTYKLWEIDKTREEKKVEKVKYAHNEKSKEFVGNLNRHKDTVYFAKTHPDAKIPSKRDEDGCYDVYACFDEEHITLQPGEIKMIPTGIASYLPKKYRFNCKRERGSTGTLGLVALSGQIDSSYQNEWFVVLQNTNDIPISISKEVTEKEITEDYIILPYSKAIVQAGLEIVPQVDVKTIPYEELLKFPSERGLGKLGSSGK